MSYPRQDNQRRGEFHSSRKKNASQVAYFIMFFLILLVITFIFRSLLASAYYSIKESAFPKSDTTQVTAMPDAAYVAALQADNDQLKEMLGRSTSKDTLTLAAVLVRPPQTPYDSIIIDVGTDSNVAVGDIIYADMDYAIGKVSSVSGHTSVVTLFSSPGQKENVLIGSSTISAVAEGRGGGNFYVKLPESASVQQGDPIIWPDIKEILLGTADDVETDSGDAYIDIYFKSPVNIQTLRYVEFSKNNS